MVVFSFPEVVCSFLGHSVVAEDCVCGQLLSSGISEASDGLWVPCFLRGEAVLVVSDIHALLFFMSLSCPQCLGREFDMTLKRATE